jgi:lysophospholipase L1-like esterase
MRHTLFIFLLCVSLASAADREGLGRSFHHLAKTGELTIGYFGGSITAGAGASKSSETSFRALTTKSYRDTFPAAKITEVNAAIGGTGSDLGAFRCHKDLLDRNPDLVFVEFAVNDSGAKPDRIHSTMEGIVRQIWQSNPAADIVFLYTVAKSTGAIYDRGETPPAVIADEEVAEAYRIPSINIGKAIWQQIHDGKQTWATMLPDNTHPNDAGYAIYTKAITDFLSAHRSDKEEPAHATLRAPISPMPWEKAHLVDASEIAAEGWNHDEPSARKQFPHSIATPEPGKELKYRFNGTVIGVYWVIAPDSGDIEYSIDGGAPQHASSWDKYALRFTRVNYKIFSDNLAPGDHELVLKVLPEPQAESKGTWIRIGALLVN